MKLYLIKVTDIETHSIVYVSNQGSLTPYIECSGAFEQDRVTKIMEKDIRKIYCELYIGIPAEIYGIATLKIDVIEVDTNTYSRKLELHDNITYAYPTNHKLILEKIDKIKKTIADSEKQIKDLYGRFN